MSAQDRRTAQTLTQPSQLVDYGFLYTEKTEAVFSLRERQRSAELKERVNLKARLTPELKFLADKPHLIFFRQLATPLHETLYVIELAHELDLNLLILEFLEDKFVGTANCYKRGLGKLPVHTFTTESGHTAYRNYTIVDFNTNTGRKICDVETVTGESLVKFHHDLFKTVTTIDVADVAIDGSQWFKQFAYGAEEYYEALMTLFLTNGILAEVFWNSGEDEIFMKKVVVPAYNKVTSQFNLNPLIINYQPTHQQTDIFWDCYPNNTADFLKVKGYI